jgi:hypothetical protein
MADFSMNVNYAKPQVTSLADMVNMAGGIQNYQQAQQMNPLALQRAQQEVEQAKQMNPLALQKAMMEIEQAKQMNPLAVRKSAAETQVSEETVKPRISQAESQSAKAMSEAQAAQLETTRAFLNNARRETTHLINKKDLTVDDVKDHYKNNIYNAVEDPRTREQAYNQAIAKLPKDPKDLRQYLIRDLTGTVTAETQLDKLFPATQMVSKGNALVPVTSGNPELSMTGAPGLQAGPEIGVNLAPQVFANPITQQPTILGGGGKPPTPSQSFQDQFLAKQQAQKGMPQNAPQSMPQVVPQGAPQGMPQVAPQGMPQQGAQVMPQGGVMPARQVPGMAIQPQASGQLMQGANESPANFNARVAQTQGQYASALDQYNNPQSQAGHIPTVQTINNNILGLLKDKDVNTGAIADYLGKKTNKGALNAKEQELTKYLEQRIQNLGPRTDQDAVNMKNAFGSFNLDKEAIKEIIRNDNTWVTTKDLMAKGILHNGANPLNPQNPNYGAVSNFTSNFAQFSNNPTLMRYISLVGEKNKVHLDDDDKTAFSKLVGGMSQEQRAALEQQRQQLLKLVNPRGQ